MHVPDGFLSPQITIPAYAAAAPLLALAARRRLRAGGREALPVLGSLAAVAFVLQTIRIPVPGGSSTHVLGTALLAVLHGPLAAFACESAVLAVQALFFGAGGVTTLAVNALAMGLLGPAAGWLAFRALRPLGERAAAFAGGWVATQAASLAVVLVLALQHALDPEIFPVAPAAVAAATLVPSALVTGLVEGAYTAVVLGLLGRARLRADA
jgi:cobalt/nickel transport system permease protein